jgi:hypothetical protein
MSTQSPAQIRATIKDAVIEDADDGRFAFGAVYGHIGGVFADGAPFRTATITSGPDEGGVVQTEDGDYRLEMRPE